MENSTDSASRSPVTPYGRAYPPRFALRPAAYGVGLRLRRGTPAGFPRLRRLPLRQSCWPTARRPTRARHAAPVLTPPPAPSSSTVPTERPQKRFSREKRLAEAVPHINRQRGRKARRLNARGKADSQAAELASIAIPDEEGPEPHPGRTGAPRSAQEARNRARVGDRCRRPRKTPPRPAQGQISTPTRSRPGWPWPGA